MEAPTCTEAGTERRDCERCDHFETQEVDPLGHNMGDWIIDVEPTSGVEGSKHKECTVCGETLETEVMEALPMETDAETETDVNTEPELPIDSESNQNSSDSSDGCSSTVSVTAFGVILLAASASMFLVKRREENC
jgi:hypothetical protein